MPTLDWIGKQAVVNHHREVPYHLLKCDKSLSVGDPGSGNLLVQGDNLIALKALLPYYAGKVKCIFIDPPYNTGNESWVYNDNVNSPEIRRWLGKVVGAEAEDLSRHDKWLCMMYPRLMLLREFLRDDGAIFICIDDNEVHRLRSLADEIFGPREFVATIVWENFYGRSNAACISPAHNYIVVYSPLGPDWKDVRNLLPRDAKSASKYKNPDNDRRGQWRLGPIFASGERHEGLMYTIATPSGRRVKPPPGSHWRMVEDDFWQLVKEDRIVFGAKGNNVPAIKLFLHEVQSGLVPRTWWPAEEVGHSQDGKRELQAIFDGASPFDTPKPLRLLDRIIHIATDKDDLILDSFAGSGGTGHAVLQKNREDGGSRQFILIEMEPTVCQDVAAQRLSRVLEQTARENGGGGQALPPFPQPDQSDGFRFCKLADPLFDEAGQIRSDVTFADLAAHVFFTETGEPIPKRASGKSPLIGVCHNVAFYLLFNGVLGDKRPAGGNVLTSAVLDSLPTHDGPKVIYGESCRLGDTRLRREDITFKQVPYEIKVR